MLRYACLPSRASGVLRKHHTLVLLRHGQSTWNAENRFTGWVDVPLTAKGREEATAAGELLRGEGLSFDVAFTSVLRRAVDTLDLALLSLGQGNVPTERLWRLNERHYGALQGLNKQETLQEHGAEKVIQWRRSYAVPPPALDAGDAGHPKNDPAYSAVDPGALPSGESLELTARRVLPEWEATIAPAVRAGRRVLVVAHGNSLRALVMHLDGISERDIVGLNIPTGARPAGFAALRAHPTPRPMPGVPLVYRLDERTLAPLPSAEAFPPLSGRYLGDREEVARRVEVVIDQASIGGR